MKTAISNERSKERKGYVDWILYDAMKMTAAASNTLTFFQNTIGSVGKARTNMQNAGSLPSPKTFAVQEICARVINPSGAPFRLAGGASPTVLPLTTIFSTMFFEFRRDPATDYEGHGSQLFEAPMFLNDDAETPIGSAVIQDAILYKSIKLNTPILLDSNRAFSLNVQFTAPTDSTNGFTASETLIYFFLKGILRRNA